MDLTKTDNETFLTEQDLTLKCSICQKEAKKLVELEGSSKLLCPDCMDSEEEEHHDAENLQDMRVRCAEADCTWKGVVGELQNHIKICRNMLIPCPNNCNRNNQIRRRDLEKHLTSDCINRDYECEYCGQTGTYEHVTKEHVKVCQNMAIPCPNTDCGMIVERCKMAEHLQASCEFSEVACKYKKIGCIVSMVRKSLKQHEEDDEAHLSLALEKLSELTENVATSRQELALLTNRFENLLHSHEKMLQSTASFSGLKYFSSTSKHFLLVISLFILIFSALIVSFLKFNSQNSEVSSFNVIIQLKENVKLLETEALPQLKKELTQNILNMDKDFQSQNIEITSLRMAIPRLEEKLSQQVTEISALTEARNRNNISSIYDSMHSLENAMSSLKQSYAGLRGEMNWIKQKGSIIRMVNLYVGDSIQLKECIPHGITLIGKCYFILKVYPNGYGEANGTHLSIALEFEQSTCHSYISSGLLFDVELLNQEEDDDHHRASIECVIRQQSQGYIFSKLKFLRHSDAPHSRNGPASAVNAQPSRARYMKNDILYFRISVKAMNEKPWLDWASYITIPRLFP